MPWNECTVSAIQKIKDVPLQYPSHRVHCVLHVLNWSIHSRRAAKHVDIGISALWLRTRVGVAWFCSWRMRPQFWLLLGKNSGTYQETWWPRKQTWRVWNQVLLTGEWMSVGLGLQRIKDVLSRSIMHNGSLPSPFDISCSYSQSMLPLQSLPGFLAQVSRRSFNKR